jgi:hypothetical protein
MFDSKMLMIIIPALMLCAAIYFLPSIIAVARHHHNALAIFLLNLFLGWTMLGWVGSLVWSVTATAPRIDKQGEFLARKEPHL